MFVHSIGLSIAAATVRNARSLKVKIVWQEKGPRWHGDKEKVFVYNPRDYACEI